MPLPTTHPAHHRAVVVTALPVEYAAVRAHLTNLSEDEHPEGDVYERGLFQAGAQHWEIGIVEMGMGNPNAAQKTERALAHFKPDVVLFVGVAGGIKDATLGDVVVATKVYGYHAGKADADFKTRPEVGLPQHRILERARAEARKSDWLNRLKPVPDPAPRVFLGAIAAGEQVVTSTQSDSYQLIRNAYNDALAVEMESYGFLKAAQSHSGLEALAVRGISDLIEGKAEADQSGSQARAARHAAAFAFEVLAKLTLPDKAVRIEVREIIREAAPTSAPPVHSTLPNLPFFVGRVEELKIIEAALAPDARTWGALIDGPGGIGKTALAIKAAHDAPPEQFARKIFITAKVRELRPEGERQLTDFTRPTYLAMLDELGRELGDENIFRLAPDDRPNALRLALAGRRTLIIFDNLETLPEGERTRLFQFLSRLPEGNKAIVTSRRRSDVDARIVRLDRLTRDEARLLMDELAGKYPRLQRASQQEWDDLYAITHGNPLFIRWIAGQLGRPGSQCRTIAEACAFIAQAPPDNDPLEYIFGDLLESFTADETQVLAALTYFTQPARPAWLAQMTGLPARAAETALEDLTDRSILAADYASQTYYLPPLAAAFIRARRPGAVSRTGDALVHRAYALAVQYGGDDNYDGFRSLDAEWDLIAAALPRLLTGDNGRLQTVCRQLNQFLDFTGRWDDWLWLSAQAEARAVAAGDNQNAGWRAFDAGWVYTLRNQAGDVLACAARAAAHWQAAPPRQQAVAIHLRGLGHRLQKDYPAAIAAYRESLDIRRAIAPESADVASTLNDLAGAERLSQDYAAAERDHREALRVATAVNDQEGVAILTGNLAELALDREQWEAAESLAREALTLAEKVGKHKSIAHQCYRIAKALLEQSRRSDCQSDLHEALSLARRAVAIFTRLRYYELPEAQETLTEIEQALNRPSGQTL